MPAEETTDNSVGALRESVERSIGDTVDRLRKIEANAQARLRQLTLEQQHLQTIVTDLHYRLQSFTTSADTPKRVTGPLTPDQLTAMQGQEENLTEHRTKLERTKNELEGMGNRLSWLIHQIEGACDWVLSPGEGENDSDGDSDGTPGNASTPNEQVMWAQIVMGQEAERARLAREVHDGPAQALSNAVMRLALVEQMFKYRPEEVQPELARMKAGLQASLSDVRRFMFNLRPASLTDVGLLPTLRQYARDYAEQYGIPVEVNLPNILPLSANQELVVFRVIQEALQNIHKHAEATEVEITVAQKAKGPLTVSIRDNGKGFDPKAVRQRSPASSGLVSMRERAATVGGTLKLESKPNAGSTVTIVLPMPKGN